MITIYRKEPNFVEWPLWVGFTILFVLSLIFEIIENARCTIEKYREVSGTSRDYDGDSYQNTIADLIVVQSWGFIHKRFCSVFDAGFDFRICFG